MFDTKNKQGVKAFEAADEIALENKIGEWLQEGGKVYTVFSVSMTIDPNPKTPERYKALLGYTLIRYQS